MEVLVKNLEELANLAKEELKKALEKDARPIVFALRGELGAGKTAFTQALARELGIKEELRSPTFLLIKAFKLPQPSKDIERLVHIDAYRIESPQELIDLGLKNIVTDPKNIVAIEWAERITEYLPEQTTGIDFEIIGKEERRISVNINKYRESAG